VSFRVLVVPEDPINNGYILQPLVERMMTECGKPQARVNVLTNPRATGYSSAKSLLEEQLLDAYPMCDLFLFLPDNDGGNRSGEFRRLEQMSNQKGRVLLCCAAMEEVEAWLLAGHTDILTEPWVEIRADPSVKEHVFEPFMRSHGDPRRAGGGRDLLMNATLSNYRGLLQRCPELAELEQRIRALPPAV
jgi:hypothetical protein